MPQEHIDGLTQIGISGLFGAVSAISQLLGSAKILTPRRIFASWFGGLIGGVVCGAFAAEIIPSFHSSHIVIAASGAVGAIVGVNGILAYYFYKHAPGILKHDSDEPDSVTVDELINSGKHSQSEIEKMIERERERRKHRKS